MIKEKIQGTQLITRACYLLMLFADKKPEMSLVELAELSELNISTTYRILQALVLEGFLNQDSSNGKYRLGLRLHRLGEVSMKSNDLYRISYPWLESLAEKWGELVILHTVTPKLEFDISIFFASRYMIGAKADSARSVMPHASAGGKLLLAFLPAEKLEDYLTNSLKMYTENTIVCPEKLIEEFEKIRAQGYSTNYEEAEIGFNAVAAPVVNFEGKIVAAVSLGGPATRINNSNLQEIVESVVQTGKAISNGLGGM